MIKSTDMVVDLLLNAVDHSTEALISTNLLPKSPAQKAKLANGWNGCSGGFGIIYGHLALIDGWLATAQKPFDVPNPSDYRSGCYQYFGVNVQAMCDSNICIMYVSITGPGRMNDTRAHRTLLELYTWLDQLDDQYFCSGDNTYTLSDNVLIPFISSDIYDEYNKTYIFHLSQLRIPGGDGVRATSNKGEDL